MAAPMRGGGKHSPTPVEAGPAAPAPSDAPPGRKQRGHPTPGPDDLVAPELLHGVATRAGASGRSRRRTPLRNVENRSREANTQAHFDQLVAIALREALDLFATAEGGIYLYHPEARLLYLAYTSEASHGLLGRVLALGEGVAGRAARQRRANRAPVVALDYSAVPDSSPTLIRAGVRSVVALPLFHDNELVGVLDVVNAQPEFVTPERLAVLNADAGEIAVALRNARDFGRLQQRAMALGAIGRLSAIFYELRETTGLVRAALDEVVAIFASPRVALYLPREGELALFAVAGHGPDSTGPMPEQAVRKVFKSRKALFVPPARAEAVGIVPNHTYGEICVPVGVQGEVLGALHIWSGDRLLSEDDVPLAELFATSIAAALANAQAHERNARLSLEQEDQIRARTAELYGVVRQLQMAAQVSHELAADLREDELRAAIPSRVGALLGYREVALLVVDEAAGTLVYHGAREGSGGPPVALHTQGLDQGLCGWVASTGQSVYVPDVLQDSRYVPGDDVRGARSELDLPVRARGKLFGVLSVTDNKVDAFTPYDRLVLGVVADHLGVALSNARLYAAERRRERDAVLLARAGRLFNSTLELDKVLAGIAEMLAEAVGDGCAISLFDPDSGPLALRALACRPEVANVDAFRDNLLAESRVLGHTLHEIRTLVELPVFIQDAGATRDVPSSVYRLGMRSVVQTPLVGRGGKILGTLLNWISTPNRHYTEEDRALAVQLADQAALAIENAQLYEESSRQRREELTFSTLALDVVSSLDRHTVLQRIARHAQYLLAGDMAVIILHDPERNVLVASAFAGLTGLTEQSEHLVVLAPDCGVAGLVWQSWQAVVVEDYFSDTRITHTPHVDRTATALSLRSLLAVPIALGAERLGVLQVGTARRRIFTGRDRQLLLRVATQAALAVRNARLFDDSKQARDLAERRAHTLSGLLDTSRAIASRLELATLLETLLDRLLALIPADSGGLYFVEDGYLRPATMRAEYLSNADFSTFTIDRGLGGWIVRHAQPVLCHAATEDPRYFAPPGAVAEDRSLLGAPLIADGEVVAVLMLGSLQEDRFNDDDLSLLVAFAGQAAVAIKNARLFAAAGSRARRLAMLNETGRALSAVLDLPSLFATLYEQTRRVLPADTFFVALYDEAHESLTVPYLFNSSLKAVATEADKLNELDAGPTMRVIQSRRPLLVLDRPDGQQQYDAGGPPTAGAIGASPSRIFVPLLAGEHVLGVISVQSYAYAAYDDDDMLALQTVASQAVNALQNARSYEQAQERSERLLAVSEIVKAIRSTPDLDVVVRLVADRARRVVPVDESDVVRVHPDGEVTPWSHPAKPLSIRMKQLLRRVTTREEATSEATVFDTDELDLVVAGNEDAAEAAATIRSMAVAPVRDSGVTVALLRVSSSTPRPFNDSHLESLRDLADHLGIAIQNMRLARQTRELYLAGVKSLAAMVDAKDRYTHGHSERVAGYSKRIAVELGLPSEDVEAIELAGLMHDIGKIGIPDAILQKPGRLEPDEMQVMMTHAASGADILASNESLAPLAPFVRSHHERWDGAGYPDRLAGTDIPLGATIIGAADTFDTMTSDRPYRKAPGLAAAQAELARCAGTQFRSDVVAALFRVIGAEDMVVVERVGQSSARDETLAGQITPVETRGLRILNRLAAHVGGLTDLNSFLSRVLEIVTDEVKYENCGILLLDDALGQLVVRASVPVNIVPIGSVLPAGRGLSHWVVEHGVAANVPDVTSDPRFFAFYGSWRSNLVVPLMVDGRAIGVINLQDERVAAFTQADEQLWSTIAGQLAQTIEVARLHDALKRLATTDGLTGVANHRHFYDRLEEELARSHRNGSAVGLVVLDVDSLKTVNDTYGHLVGDALLRAVATTLIGITRREDIVARYGGDEFTVILADTREEDILAFEERVRAAFNDLRVLYDDVSIAPVVSVGSARFPEDGTRAKTLILVADQRLYERRRSRRAQAPPA